MTIRVRKKQAKDSFHRLEELSKELPYSYNETKLVLLARDPFWGYTYWDFSGESWKWAEDLCKWNPELRPILRIHNLKDQKQFDIDISLEAKNWYISFGKPNCEFEAELGLLGSDGKFYVIAKSNRICTPRNSPSDIIDPQWAPEDFDELYRLSGGDLSSQRSSDLSSQFRKRRTQS